MLESVKQGHRKHQRFITSQANMRNTLVCQAASAGNCRQQGKEAVSVTNLKDIWGKRKKYLANGEMFVLPLNRTCSH